MSTKSKINRKYKDRLFCLFFGSEENKMYLLSLYNALNNTNHTNIEDLEINTIDDAIYMRMKNDLSFIFLSMMHLYEHQSTYNPNMPLRGFLYFARVYEEYIETRGLDVYGGKLIKIPTPKYIVFYNGIERNEDIIELRLSDSFLVKDDSNKFEWTATMYNINHGHNKEIMEKCEALSEYAELINLVRENVKQNMSLEEAVDAAVKTASSWKCMGSFLTKHRSEVKDMILTEFNEARHEANLRAEGRSEGIAVGRVQGESKFSDLLQWLMDSGRTDDVNAAITNLTRRKELYEEYEDSHILQPV